MTAPEFHVDVLTTSQRNLMTQLGPMVSQEGFYLGGGTAVALQLGHRRSVDFDWFTESPFVDPLEFAQRLRASGLSVRVVDSARATLHTVVRRVRVSFFGYRYPLLRPPVVWPDAGCKLASLEDLACMKLSAIAQRGSKKDFVDLYALGNAGFRLPEMLKLYQQRFHVQDVAHLVYSLVYFDDADSERAPKMIWKVRWPKIKSTIRAWTEEVTERSRTG